MSRATLLTQNPRDPLPRGPSGCPSSTRGSRLKVKFSTGLRPNTQKTTPEKTKKEHKTQKCSQNKNQEKMSMSHCSSSSTTTSV